MDERTHLTLDTGHSTWHAAHSLLSPAFEGIDNQEEASSQSVIAVGLFLIACFHLEHTDHLLRGTHWLQRMYTDAVTMTPEAEALTLLHLARDKAGHGEYIHAQTLIDRAVSISATTSVSAWTQCYTHIVKARILARLGDLPHAEQTLLRSTALAFSDGSPALLADSLTALANVRHLRRRFESADKLYEQAITYYWRACDTAGLCSALLNRASVLLTLGCLDSGRRLLGEVLKHARASGKASIEIKCQLCLGWVLAREKETAAARTTLLTAFSAARNRGLLREQVLALEYLADAFLLADPTEASLMKVALFIRTGKMLAHSLAPSGDLALELNIREALLSLVLGDLPCALLQAKEAAEHARRADMPWEEALARRVAGMALVHIGRSAEGLAVLRESLQGLERIRERLESAITKAWIDSVEGNRAGSYADPDSANMYRSAADQAPGYPADSAEGKSVRAWISHPRLGPPRHPATQEHTSIIHIDRAAAIASPHDPRDIASTPRTAIGGHPKLVNAWRDLGLVTRAPKLVDTLRLAEVFSPERIPVLILGETGTGKDLVAQGIHRLSARSGKYIPINCAAISKDVFIAELFGTTKGAYTGATHPRPGLLREAQHGTLFLDEVADLSPEAQGYLLRFLDTGEVRPIGSAASLPVDVRVVSATAVNLRERVASGSFRPDLFSRLTGIILTLPPLRERVEDLELLIPLLWARLGGQETELNEILSVDMLQSLRKKPWPGNVRELMHALSRALPLLRRMGSKDATDSLLVDCASEDVHVSQDSRDEISLEHYGVPEHFRGIPSLDNHSLCPLYRVLAKDPRGKWPREVLLSALHTAHGRVSEAAKILGVSRSQAYRLYRNLRQ